MILPTLEPTPKRVVFVHTDGIHQILGTVSEPPVSLVPDGAAAIQVRGQVIPFASLYKVTTRSAFYKAPTVPQSFKPSDRPLFDRNQR